MEKHTIGGLKNILVASSHFYDIQDYFLTITETNYQAIDGKAGKNKILKEIILSTLTELSRRQGIVDGDTKIMLVNMMMVEVRQRHFWHGSGMVNGKHVYTYFYFADLDKGLVSLSKGTMSYYARVSIKPAHKKNPMEEFSDN
jgi:hypothetical protein